jgi:hypothetical protein
MNCPEEESGRKAAPVVLRLFGVDVRRVGDEELGGFELRKCSSMPDLTVNSTDPVMPPADGKGYAADDLEMSSRQQKRRRRKAQERKKGDFLSSPSRIRLLPFLACRGSFV